MYFVGVVLSCVIVPPLADAYGRKWIIFGSYIILIVGLVGLMLSNNLYAAYVFELFVGFAFAGHVIVGLNYLLEYSKRENQDYLTATMMILGAMIGILMTIWYQFIDKGWFLLQIICLFLAVISFLYTFFLVPESPKWLYINFRFDEAREALHDVADVNWVSDRRMSRLSRLTFDIEVLQKLKDADGASRKSNLDEEIAKRLDTISERQYTINIALMTVQWSACSFTFYMLMFMNKYYEGQIFINFYLDSVAGIIGPGISILLYSPCKTRLSFILSLTFTIISGTFLLCFQQ